MGEILQELETDYKKKLKEAKTKEEKNLIKKDYNDLKPKLKEAEKIIEKYKLDESSDDFWDNMEFPSLDESVPNIKMTKDEAMKKMDADMEVRSKELKEQMKHTEELLKKIDAKIAELEKKENNN